MKILIYNWVAFDNDENKGGGVNVYTRNLVRELVKDESNIVFFLCAGQVYDIDDTSVRIERYNNIFGDRVKSYQVVNSPIFSSAKISFPFPETYLQDKILANLVENFIIQNGGFDVIHLQNIEGLSLKCLALKEKFPNIKFIYSLHNYYPFCPAVNRWSVQDRLCTIENCGLSCTECMPKDIFAEKIKFNQYINYKTRKGISFSEIYELKEFKEKLCKKYSLVDTEKRYSEEMLIGLGHEFTNFNLKTVESLNKYMDVILAVSDRVKRLAVQYGILDNKIKVNYIGTEAAANLIKWKDYKKKRGLHICYLGYANKQKGFFFFLDSLKQMPADAASMMKVTIAAKTDDNKVIGEIKCLNDKFDKVTYYNGYTHNELIKILNDVDLGIVPVLWEDNLPQVAIEMKCAGIPVLCSDLGGAKELSGSEKFVFKHGNIDSFISHLTYFIQKPKELGSYFDGGVVPPSMAEHIKNLKEIYEE